MTSQNNEASGGGVRNLPASFWLANVMEIFERMSWYGFFAVSSLYITGSVEEGGLGFTDEDRGVLQGVVTFFLYLFPVVTGALADRYGFRKTLVVAYLLLVPGYYLLGQFSSFWGFFGAFMFVAVGAAVFKPVIIATVARTTNSKTAPIGFGIFYMMVNIGGFLGPVVAGVVRGWGWNYVFIMSSVWISLNFIVVLFYREPGGAGEEAHKKSFGQVMSGMVEVMGNGRFFITVFGTLILLVLGSKWVEWKWVLLATGGWIGINLIIDVGLKFAGKVGQGGLVDKMRIGNWRFVLFLLLMSGFYSAFNQLFITLPLYIRDFTDTRPIYDLAAWLIHGVGITASDESLQTFLLTSRGTFKPEYLININAGCIVLFQLFVSSYFSKRRPFVAILVGLGLVVVSFSLFTLGVSAWAVVGGIVIFSFGEMMASPKAKEYVGRIAPPDRVGLYMGYFFWCMALGNLISGVMSGQLWGWLARDMQRPDIMWGIFAGMGALTAVGVVLYDRFVVPKKSEA